MTRQIPLIFLLLVSINCFGQEPKNSSKIHLNESHYPSGRSEYILILDTLEVSIDSAQVSKLNPKQIRKIEVLKEKKDMHNYNSKSGVLLIYPKRKYTKKLIKKYLE